MSTTGSIGHVLLQPERLRRAGAAAGVDALIDDLVAAISRVTADGAQGGTILQDLESAVEALVARLLERAGGGMYRAVDRLQDIVRPLAPLAERLPAIFDHDDPADVAAAMIEQLGSLAEATAGLTLERVRDTMQLLLDVVQEELKLTSAVLDEEFWGLLDDVIARVETIPDDLDPALRANRVVVGDVLRRARRHMHGTITFPDLSADRLATLLFEVLEPLLGEPLRRLACIGHVTDDAIEAVKAVVRVVPYTGFGSRSIAAADAAEIAERQYLWYASWLLGDADVAFYELWRFNGDVWIDRTAEQAMIRFREDGLYPADAFSWTNIPIGDDPLTVTFKHVDADAMEKIAWHSAWAAESLESLFHLWGPLGGVQGGKGGQPSWVDILDFMAGGVHTAMKAGRQAPLSFIALPGDGWGRVLSWLPNVGAHGLGSLQGLHTKASGGNAVKMWGLILMTDIGRYATAGTLPGLAREALLSFLTMLNYDGPAEADDSNPRNHQEMDGVLALFQLLGTILTAKLSVELKYYGHPFTGDSTQVPDFSVTAWLRNNLLFGTIFGLLNGFVGTFLVWALMAACGSPAINTRVLRDNVLVAVLKSLGLFWLNVYVWRENNTDGGRYNPTGAAFAGYRDTDASPYLLPWKGDETYMCFQGNMGYFSHNHTNPGGSQIYAYDFMLDKGDEVRAARGGTVVDYFDWCPDDENVSTTETVATIRGQTQTDSWNFIAIRHDTTDVTHDVGEGGNPTTTYAVYGHGLNGGVRNVFGARTPAVAPASIIGTVVAQGDPIMLADSTGVSACNHLHMEVRSAPAAPPATVAVGRGLLGPTIPFVFKDGEQPSSHSWLMSANVKT